MASLPLSAIKRANAGPVTVVIHTHLNDRTPICIREVTQDDEQRLKDGIAKLSKRSRYMRFFSGMRTPPQSVIDKLLDVDGHDHIAWGALRSDLPEEPALGIVHAFRDECDFRNAEFSVAVIDEYHGRGLARLMTAVLLIDCYQEGIREFTVHILAENEAALSLVRLLGGAIQSQERGVTELEIDIGEAIESLRAESDLLGLEAVFSAFEKRPGSRLT